MLDGLDMLFIISFCAAILRVDSLTLLASFNHIFLHPVCFPQVPEILGIFFNLSTLRTRSISLRLFSYFVVIVSSHAWRETNLLLMTPPTKPETVVEVISSLPAPFLAANPSGDSALHSGQSRSWYPGVVMAGNTPSVASRCWWSGLDLNPGKTFSLEYSCGILNATQPSRRCNIENIWACNGTLISTFWLAYIELLYFSRTDSAHGMIFYICSSKVS